MIEAAAKPSLHAPVPPFAVASYALLSVMNRIVLGMLPLRTSHKVKGWTEDVLKLKMPFLNETAPLHLKWPLWPFGNGSIDRKSKIIIV